MLNFKNNSHKEKCFILELHDVTAHFAKEFDGMLQAAEELGAGEPVIMWIPRWAGRGNNREDMALGSKIGSLTAEIVLHGCTHNSTGSILDKIWYGEPTGAEFKKLHKAKAHELLRQGKSQLEQWSGKTVNWFCAPRWQQGKGTTAALRELDFKGYFEKNRVVFINGEVLPIPVLSFDNGSRKLIQRVNNRLRKRFIRKLLKSPGIFRLALHPRDMNSPVIVKEIKNICNLLQGEGWRAIPLKALESVAQNGL